jgi:hypothetical protein
MQDQTCHDSRVIVRSRGRIQSGFAGLSVSVVLVGLTRAHLLDLDEQPAFSGS